MTQAAEGVKNGKAADLPTMIATAKQNGVELKIVDTKDYVKTEDDKKNNVQVVYVEKRQNNEIGHAYYMDKSGSFVEAKTTGQDCFYGAFQEILRQQNGTDQVKSISELRNETAKYMQDNAANFSEVLKAENWIRHTHPGASNDILFTAGLKKESGKFVTEDSDLVPTLISLKKHKNRGGFNIKVALYLFIYSLIIVKCH